IQDRFQVPILDTEILQVMDSIGSRRGCIIKGGGIDYEKTARLILDEFRKGLLGRITLEKPEDVL
ncbi:MAG TPA: ribosome biogenesis GTPase YlqF, partial [Tissierellales bacterium]|nr:ribosome biogenesis GTPase YlqF [Tissierellales bacterium]